MEIEYRPGRLHCNTDGLSRRPWPENTEGLMVNVTASITEPQTVSSSPAGTEETPGGGNSATPGPESQETSPVW